jgi:hypothetical protein
MKNWGFLFCFFCSYALINSAKGQNISNEGRDFWAVFPTHDPSRGSLANIQIFITSKEQSEVTITCNNYNSGPQTIAPNTAVSFEIPREDAYISAGDAGRVLSSRAIHVVVTPGKPKVAVYAHIFAGHRSAASIILPAEALGQTYYSMNYTQSVNGESTNKNYIAVIATEDDTHLLIHPKGSTLPPVEITLPKAGDVFEYVPIIVISASPFSPEARPFGSVTVLTTSVTDLLTPYTSSCTLRPAGAKHTVWCPLSIDFIPLES